MSFAALAAAGLLAGSATAAPPGASARCRDGTYSYSTHRSGTCSWHGGVALWLTGGSVSVKATAASAGVAVGRVVLVDRRTRASGCRRGVLPDRRCSPGATSSGLTKAVICAAGFRTGSIRNVPGPEKYAVEREYGMVARPYGRAIEIDHIVSLELGGSNDIANLFPEPGSGAAGYHAKDKLENRVHSLVCAGAMTLTAAQQAIAHDWKSLYVRVFGSTP